MNEFIRLHFFKLFVTLLKKRATQTNGEKNRRGISFFYMKMRNPLKPKNKSRRFAELQEDQGFTDAQFETTKTPSM